MQEDNNTLAKNILFTIAYYNAMDYPLTTFELWQQLLSCKAIKGKKSLSDIIEKLHSPILSSRLKNVLGFWMLQGEKNDLAEKRLHAQKISIAKLKKAKRWVGLIEWIPYVRGIFITGTLAMKRSNRESDWDVLVVTKRKRIWIARLLLTFWLHVFGKRRHGKHLKNRFCLNHYITEQGLIFEERNEFAANEIIFSIALFGKQIHHKFVSVNEHWIQSYKPNFDRSKLLGVFEKENSQIWKIIQKALEVFLEITQIARITDAWSKKAMVKKINNNPKTYLESADIRYGDMALVFLPKPQREEIFQTAKRKLEKLSSL